MGTMYHNPVLLQASVDGLNIQPDGVYVDATFGGGGHSREILNRLSASGRLYAFDQDQDSHTNAPEDQRFTLIGENFRYMKQYLKFYGVVKVNGILADFGVSSHQFDSAERGFSTRFEGDLDMRMDRRAALTAKEVVNAYSFEQLRGLFREFGELRKAGPLAGALVRAREQYRIESTGQLKEVVQPLLQKGKEFKELAQIYQAIRMEVNGELEVLKDFMLQTPDLILSGGRLSMISYHSLEDRLAKRFIRAGKFQGEADRDFYGNSMAPFKKVVGLIVPDAEEISSNPRARSAKLRIAERN
ncbi:MAG: hypothetical protein RLZZ241_1277 [Bacteroidota bacterium]